MHTLQPIISAYLQYFPEDVSEIQLLQDQLADSEVLNTRKNFRGHATASSWILSPDLTRLLLIEHLHLGMLIQPGGHIDPTDDTPLQVARREAMEEVGLSDLEYIPLVANRPEIPIEIDTHAIPESIKKQEPSHFHHDFAYVFRSPTWEVVSQEPESVGKVEWYDLAHLPTGNRRFPRIAERIHSHLFSR